MRVEEKWGTQEMEILDLLVLAIGRFPVLCSRVASIFLGPWVPNAILEAGDWYH